MFICRAELNSAHPLPLVSHLNCICFLSQYEKDHKQYQRDKEISDEERKDMARFREKASNTLADVCHQLEVANKRYYDLRGF